MAQRQRLQIEIGADNQALDEVVRGYFKELMPVIKEMIKDGEDTGFWRVRGPQFVEVANKTYKYVVEVKKWAEDDASARFFTPDEPWEYAEPACPFLNALHEKTADSEPSSLNLCIEYVFSSIQLQAAHASIPPSPF